MSDSPEHQPPPSNALKQLEEAGALSHFASSIAHEVCNPLSQIVLATDFLANPRPLSDDMRKKIVNYLRQGAERIDKAMKSMLRACAPIETSMTLEDANALIDDALATFTVEPSINVEKHYADGLPPLLADKKHITEAIVHLIANSLDAMRPAGGTLAITTTLKVFESSEREGWQRQNWFRAGDRAVIIKITDTGHGIHSSQMPMIFEAFYTTKPAGKGAGLGLTFTKKIVDLHHGRLEITNRPEGGVLAVLTLKTAPHTPDFQPPAMSETPAAKKKILLIDDEPFITNLMAMNLEDTGRFEVREQNNSLQALDTIMDFVPDLIVLDVMMPDLDGADIIYRLKNDSRLKHIAVVFHTATVREAELSTHGGIISGFPFLPKPATTEHVISFIEKHLPK